MKNVNWSKWIAIALSIIIVTQFVQVAFLGAQKFGIGGSADAGADASRGSIAEEAYGAIWEKVSGEDSMILGAKAEANELTAAEATGTITSVTMAGTTTPQTISGGDLDLHTNTYSDLNGINIVITLTGGSTGITTATTESPVAKNIVVPEELDISGVTGTITEPGSATTSIGTVAKHTDTASHAITVSFTSNLGSSNTATLTLSGIKINTDELNCTGTKTVSWTIGGNANQIVLPRVAKVSFEVKEHSHSAAWIADAAFTIYPGNTAGTAIGSAVTTTTTGPKVYGTKLLPGDYCFEETTTPATRTGLTGVTTFSIDTNGAVTNTTDTASVKKSDNNLFTVYNPLANRDRLSIHVTDGSNNNLTGAVFTLKRIGDDTGKNYAVNDTTGIVATDPLEVDSAYELTQKTVSTGDYLPSEYTSYKITVNEQGQISEVRCKEGSGGYAPASSSVWAIAARTTLNIINEPANVEAAMSIAVVDDSSPTAQKLAGAEFTLTKKGSSTSIGTYSNIGTDGTVKIPITAFANGEGDYTLKQSKSPTRLLDSQSASGCYRNSTEYTISVSTAGVVTNVEPEASWNSSTKTLTVTNNRVVLVKFKGSDQKDLSGQIGFAQYKGSGDRSSEANYGTFTPSGNSESIVLTWNETSAFGKTYGVRLEKIQGEGVLYNKNTNIFYFTRNAEGPYTTDMSLEARTAANLDWDATLQTLTFMNQPIATTGEIEIVRNLVTKNGGTGAAQSGFEYTLYQKTNNEYTVVKAAQTTGTDGKVSFTGLDMALNGTYYITESPKDGFSGPMVSDPATVLSGAQTVKNVKYYPVEINPTSKKTTVTLTGYREYKLAVVDQNGDPVAVNVTLAPAEETYKFITNAQRTWTSGDEPHVLDGLLEDGSNYTVTVPATDTGNLTATIAVTASGTLTLTSSDTAKLKATATGNVITLERIDNKAKLAVQLYDKTASKNITYKTGASYGLYTKSGSTYTEVPGVTLSISDSGLLTSSKTLEAGTYYLAEKNQAAPSGYVPKNTKSGDTITVEYFAFAIDANGKRTITANTAKGWEYIGATGSSIRLGYEEKKGTLKITRKDAASIPAGTAVRYVLKNLKTGATTAVSSTAGSTGLTGTIDFTDLDWDTEYSIEETGSTGTGYTEDGHGEYKTYVFSPNPADQQKAQTGDTFTISDTAIVCNVTITPVASVSLNFVYKNSSGTQAEAEFTINGTFRGSSTTATFTTPTTGATKVDDFLAGNTYTVTQKLVGGTPLSYTLAISADGKTVTITKVTGGTAVATNTTTPITITMTQKLSAVTFSMEICTAELGYGLDESAEITTVAGYGFGLYTDSAATTAVTGVTNTNGTATSTVVTDYAGGISYSGLSDGTYYLRYEGRAENSDATAATKVQLESNKGAIFEVSVNNGVGTVTKRVKGSYWKVKDGAIRAYLQTGKINVTSNASNSDTKFYVYRLYEGDTDDRELPDERYDYKLDGTTLVNDMTSSEKNKFTKYVAWLEKPLQDLRSVFVLTAHAASAKLLKYGTADDEDLWWELLGSKSNPGVGKSISFENLISGQAYLIREGTSETASSSDKYYLVNNLSTNGKSVAGVASSNSSSSSSKSGATAGRSGTNTGTGTGTQNSGSAGGARGAATGDDSRLWFHLIVMLVAFDALAADLLFITRKKKKQRAR